MALGGGALARAAAEVRDKGRRIAARLLEAAPEDVMAVPAGSRSRASPSAGDVEGGGRPRPTRAARAPRRRRRRARGQRVLPGRGRGVELRRRGRGGVDRARDRAPRTSSSSCGWTTPAPSSTRSSPRASSTGPSPRGWVRRSWSASSTTRDGQLLAGTLMDYALPARRRGAAGDDREDAHAVAAEPARRQGPRRGGLHRHPPALVNAAVDALAPFGVGPSRHAAHSRPALGRDAGPGGGRHRAGDEVGASGVTPSTCHLRKALGSVAMRSPMRAPQSRPVGDGSGMKTGRFLAARRGKELV